MPQSASPFANLPISSPCAAHGGKETGLDDLLPGGTNHATYQTSSLAGALWWGDCLILSSEEELFQKGEHHFSKSTATFSQKMQSYSEEAEALVSLHAATGECKRLFTFDQLNRFLSENGLNKVYTLSRLAFPRPNEHLIQVELPGQGYAWIDFAHWQMVRKIELPPQTTHADVSPNLQAVAYTTGHNLFVATASGSRQVTDEPEGVLCGQKVHREEWGITKGTFWSPDGQLLAFYRMDERMVDEHYLAEVPTLSDRRPAVRYPMAGTASHKVTVGIYNLTANKIIYLQTGDPTDRYFTNLAWSPDSTKVYIIELQRAQNRAELCRYDAPTGQREGIIVAEEQDKYIQPLHPIAFVPWMENTFLYHSRRDGFDHFYLYHTDGTLLGQLTQGPWLVGELLGFDSERHELIFTSNQASPLQQHAYRLTLEEREGHIATSSPSRCSAHSDGWQEATLSSSGRFLLSREQSHNRPGEAYLIDGHGQRPPLCLLSAPDPYRDCRMPSIEIGTLTAADGSTPLYYRLMKPADFNPAQRYPVILYVYGGPGIRLISDRWLYDARGWDLFMANRGYLVFSLDSRGSCGRSLAFENCTYLHLGIEEGRDQMRGIEFLKSLPYVDSKRIGVHGWSFGGYMTVALLLRYPDAFAAGVAGGAVIDWRLYEIMYGERYMSTPQKNAEGYAATDLTRQAASLKRPLLLIHGGQDPVVLPVHAFAFLEAAVEAGVQPDFFLYPTYGHHVLGHDRIHLYQRITRYFDFHLQCPGSNLNP